MDTDLNIITLLKSRNGILDDILNNMRTWDNTIESGINIIESNQLGLYEIGNLNAEINSLTDTFTNDEDYNYKLNLIMQELENLTVSLKGKRNTMLDEKKQFNKKDQVIKSYISINREPVFIDKDVP
jgi:hypothetical protein